MMKKLMVLCMVLGLVGIANAGVVDITITSLDGVPITPTKEITILPTQTVDFQITWNGPTNEYLFALGAIFNMGGPGGASLDYTHCVPAYKDDDDNWVYVDLATPYDPDYHVLGTGPNRAIEVALGLGLRGNNTDRNVLKNLWLHCDSFGDVHLYLSDFAQSPSIIVDNVYTRLYTLSYGPGVTIHQLIPEPMTLTLLGLGSLFLARRKK
jgi:hypothetical protein